MQKKNVVIKIKIFISFFYDCIYNMLKLFNNECAIIDIIYCFCYASKITLKITL